MCGLVVETAGERILSIRGDPDDILSRGHICPKAVAVNDEGRVDVLAGTAAFSGLPVEVTPV